MKRENIGPLLSLLNSLYESINFTIEREQDEKIPFLDLLLKRNNNKVEVSVYRKPTSTVRYIPQSSYTSFQHKMAAFNSMTYKLCRLPLNVVDYMAELKNIKRIDKINGYKSSKIDELVRKHSKRLNRASVTTVTSNDKPKRNRIYFKKILHCVFNIRQITLILRFLKLSFLHFSRNCIFLNHKYVKDQCALTLMY